jgi:hypothetical protein
MPTYIELRKQYRKETKFVIYLFDACALNRLVIFFCVCINKKSLHKYIARKRNVHRSSGISIQGAKSKPMIQYYEKEKGDTRILYIELVLELDTVENKPSIKNI